MSPTLHQLRNELVYVEAEIVKTQADILQRNCEAHVNRDRLNRDDLERVTRLVWNKSQLLKRIAEMTIVRNPCSTL